MLGSGTGDVHETAEGRADCAGCRDDVLPEGSLAANWAHRQCLRELATEAPAQRGNDHRVILWHECHVVTGAVLFENKTAWLGGGLLQIKFDVHARAR